MERELSDRIVRTLREIARHLNEGTCAETHIAYLAGIFATLKTRFPQKTATNRRDRWTNELLASIKSRVPLVKSEARIDVVWDLDDCMIKSERVRCKGAEEDPSLNTTVIRHETHEMIHVDDDLIRFRTRLRSFAHLVVGILQHICRQHVFTSATKGYMKNVVQLITRLLPSSFSPKRLSCSDFERAHLKLGKNVRELDVPSSSRGCVLIDDNPRYHQSQPTQGILIAPFSSIDEEIDDALLRTCVIILRAASRGARGVGVNSACVESNPDAYWDGLVLARAHTLSKRFVESGQGRQDARFLEADRWGPEHIGLTRWKKALDRVGLERRAKRFKSGVSFWRAVLESPSSPSTHTEPK